MRSPKKGKARLTLADLQPQQQIICFWCQQPKPAQGSRPFRAHRVCAECTQTLDARTTEKCTKIPTISRRE